MNILTLLNSSDMKVFIFIYSLQVAEDEGEEYSYKYDGSPLTLTDNIELIKDNNVAI